jgi:hypothetical protein
MIKINGFLPQGGKIYREKLLRSTNLFDDSEDSTFLFIHCFDSQDCSVAYKILDFWLLILCRRGVAAAAAAAAVTNRRRFSSSNFGLGGCGGWGCGLSIAPGDRTRCSTHIRTFSRHA